MQDEFVINQRLSKIISVNPLLKFMAIAFLGGVGFGISLSLMSLILEDRGISSNIIGWTIATSAFGVVAGLPLIPKLMRTIGTKKAVFAFSLSGVLIIGIYLLVNGPFLAFLLRFISGFIFGVLWIFIENILLRIAPKEKRATWVTLYAIAFLVGIGAGPTLTSIITSLDIDWGQFGFSFFPSGSVNPSHAVVIIMLIVIEFARHTITMVLVKKSPKLSPPKPINKGKLIRVCQLIPISLLAATVCGAIEIGVVSLGPIYLLKQSISVSDALIIIASFFFGGAVFLLIFQMFWKGGQEKLILISTLILMTVGIIAMKDTVDLWHSDQWYSIAPIVLFCVFGATTYLLFCISLLMIIPALDDSDLIIGNSAIVLFQTVAGSAFPPFAGWLMDKNPQWGLPVSMLIVTVVSLIFIIPNLKLLSNK